MSNTTQYAITNNGVGGYLLMARARQGLLRRWSPWEQIRGVQDKTTAYQLVANHRRYGLYVLDVEVIV